ncbi:hypothetical protein HRM2_15840 [Desulforapulum autotrophicum HRM2]|uniref:Uncharacterized protein n=1 Tax=Desulforapulum autotrophicum (strain ATCC 43914 / DSM 3382 / VKM B-1955 / HRM2) TaxID=177437 RepID=C0QAA8_DESAH|nr:hypothetical protein [Desulforapulum autotrophicum]ACN14693.1 hypothetical protein HRM2_15840 [Desulforapulum autotrophicum HRM2]
MKLLDKTPLSKWWAEAKENYNSDEILRVLLDNKDKLEESLAKLGGKKRLYSAFDRMFSFFSRLAGAADKISEKTQHFLMRFSWFRGFIEKARGWKNHLNFKELIEFARTKLYSLWHAPHNETAIKLLEEIVEFVSKHGVDINVYFPEAKQKLFEKKDQLLQHKFFQEFSQTRLEQLLAIQFSFDRSIFPVLPDTAFWHKFFEFAEKKKVVDIVLVNKNGKRVSFKKDSAEAIAATDTVLTLHKLSKIKNKGHRIFFVGHHEGYLGPYFVRSVIRKLGFHNLTRNCNTVVGPRMFSNVVLRNGAANVGNLFITVPSQKTTIIKTGGLAEELRKTAKRTQCLIKLPDAGLYLMKKLTYEEFMNAMVNGNPDAFVKHTSFMDDEIKVELTTFLETENFAEAMKSFSKGDYDLFKKIMKESFLIFPEGSRSYIDPDGGVVMKYVNPKYLQSYMRPGDFIASINLVGGSELTRGWHLRSATLGVSMGDPIEVTAEMIKNYEEEGIKVMRNIAQLPNIKDVRFKEEIQYKPARPERGMASGHNKYGNSANVNALVGVSYKRGEN